MEKLFRYLVVISTVFFIVYFLLPFFDHLWLSDDGRTLKNFDGYKSSIPSHLIIYWGIFSVWLVISIGLFFFVPVSRTAFLVMTVFGLLMSIFSGYRIQTPYEIVLNNTIALFDGAIISIAYLTSVSNRFRNQKP